MSDRADRIKEVVELVEEGSYFTINRPRQYGKTTVLAQVGREMGQMGYLVNTSQFPESRRIHVFQ